MSTLIECPVYLTEGYDEPCTCGQHVPSAPPYPMTEPADLVPVFIEPVIPPELCGVVGCVLTPHSSKVRHSWAEQRSVLRDD